MKIGGYVSRRIEPVRGEIAIGIIGELEGAGCSCRYGIGRCRSGLPAATDRYKKHEEQDVVFHEIGMLLNDELFAIKFIAEVGPFESEDAAIPRFVVGV